MNQLDKKQIKTLVENIILTTNNKSQFCGLEYTNQKGEKSQYVINININYANAVDNDIKSLENITTDQINNIINKGFEPELIKKCVDTLLSAFINNKNTETQSNQSEAQKDAYIHLTPCLKYNIETGLLYLHGASHYKKVLIPIEYKTVNSRVDTLCKNAIKKELQFRTEKYRQFIIDPTQLKRVKMNGEEWEIE